MRSQLGLAGLARGGPHGGAGAPSLLSVQQLGVPQQGDVHQTGVWRVEDGAVLAPTGPGKTSQLCYRAVPRFVYYTDIILPVLKE